MNQSARETGLFTHPSCGGSFKGYMPRPFHEPLNQWMRCRSPAHTPTVIPTSAQRQEREGSVLQSPTGHEPRTSPGLFTSLPTGAVKRERTTAFLAPSPHTCPAPPGAHSVAVMNPASEKEGLCPLSRVTWARGGRAERGVLILESSRTSAPWGSKGKQALPGTVQNCLCHPAKGDRQFVKVHLPIVFFLQCNLDSVFLRTC